MNKQTEKITEEAKRLSPMERAEVVEGILASLDVTDPDLDRKWAAEAQDRLDAYRRGDVEAQDIDKILAKHRSANASS